MNQTKLLASKNPSRLIDNSNGFGWISISLHWICAILIIFLFALGVWMRGLDYDSPWYLRAPEIHIATGMIVFILMVFRWGWRIKSQAVLPLPNQSRIAIYAAKFIKVMLYCLVFSVCVSGYFVVTAKGQGAHFFDLFTIPASARLDHIWADRIEFFHKYAAWTIIVLVVLHAAAALVHHFIFRDATLRRILFPDSKS